MAPAEAVAKADLASRVVPLSRPLLKHNKGGMEDGNQPKMPELAIEVVFLSFMRMAQAEAVAKADLATQVVPFNRPRVHRGLTRRFGESAQQSVRVRAKRALRHATHR